MGNSCAINLHLPININPGPRETLRNLGVQLVARRRQWGLHEWVGFHQSDQRIGPRLRNVDGSWLVGEPVVTIVDPPGLWARRFGIGWLHVFALGVLHLHGGSGHPPWIWSVAADWIALHGCNLRLLSAEWWVPELFHIWVVTRLLKR